MNHVEYISKAITEQKLTSSDQISGTFIICLPIDSLIFYSAAIKFFELIKEKSVVEKEFNEACGVGVVVTEEQVQETVASIIKAKSEELSIKRYTMLGSLLGDVKKQLRWASPLTIKEQVDKQLLEFLGPKDERDDPKKQASPSHLFNHLTLV